MLSKILSVKSKEGKTPLIILEIKSGENRRKYTVSEGTYREIGCPLSGDVIDSEALTSISEEDEKRRALLKALNILAYADNNEKTLYRKLTLAGFSRDTASETVRECVSLGYIDESRQIERLILKHYAEYMGPYKILAKLAARSYKASECSNIMRKLEQTGEIDFDANKKRLLSAKLTQNADFAEKKKILYKYGYIK